MNSPQSRNKKIILMLGDLVLILISTYLAVYVRRVIASSDITFINVLDRYTGATIFSATTYLVSFYIFEFYNLSYKFRSTVFLTRFLLGVSTATAIIAVVFYSFPSWGFGRGIFLINMFIIAFFTFFWRLAFQNVLTTVKKLKRTVIIGAGFAGSTIYNILNGGNEYQIIGFLDDNPEKMNSTIGDHSVIGNSSMLVDMCSSGTIDAAVLAITHEKRAELLQSVIDAKMKGVEVHDLVTLYETLTGKLPVEHMANTWFLYSSFQGVSKNLYMTKIKTLVNFLLSLSGLILTAPLLIASAIAIKLDSKGPVLFRQKRVGRDGKVFELLKFRSMTADAESNGAVWAKVDDSRVTKVGKFIRKWRIDEIPQMWNVLNGEMGFIGPRPERPEFVESLLEKIPYYALRHTVRPGITGWAQVNYRYGASEKDALEKIQYDLYYIKNLSPFLDLLILLRTIHIVLFRKGSR